jgi:hypothetical protein
MGLPLLIIGLLMVITGGRGTYAQFGSQVASEFQGPNSFTYWLLAIGILGAVGYIKPLQKISRLLMALVLIVIFLANKGFFAKFTQALQTGPTQPNAIPANSSFGATTSPGVTPTNPSGGSVINFGPLGTINTNPIVPGGTMDQIIQFFGGGGSGTPLSGTPSQ